MFKISEKFWLQGVIIGTLCLLNLVCFTGLSSCSKSSGLKGIKDGKYEAKSNKTDENGGYGKVSLEVKDGKIVSCKFETFKSDGSLKDETYGTSLPEGMYKVAQKCKDTCQIYADELLDKQDIDLVDGISGATFNHQIFVDAVKQALEGGKNE